MLEQLNWRVNTAGLFQEIISNNATAILTRPMQIMARLLAEVATRSADLNDPKLNALMCLLALYEISDPNSPKYDGKLTDETIRKGGY